MKALKALTEGDGCLVAIVICITATVIVGYICGTVEEVYRIKQQPAQITNIFSTNNPVFFTNTVHRTNITTVYQ